MAGRRSEIFIDERSSRDSIGRPSRHEDRYADAEISYRRSRPPPQVVERDEEIRIREDSRVPAYVRDDMTRPMVLRAREVEDFAYRPRRRSPSPERAAERESIIIRRDRSESRPPPRAPEREREEIIIRKEEIDDDVRSQRSYARPRERERDEIIIRRDESEPAPPKRAEYALMRPTSRERERSTHHRGHGDDSENEIIIRRNEREGRKGERSQEEIIIRHHSRSRSSSPAPSVRLPERQIVNAPEIHQEVITHHRHIDHGYELAIPTRRAVSRPPSPPSPPRERSRERIEIHRSGERNGRPYHEDLAIERNDSGHHAPRSRESYDQLPPISGHIPKRPWQDERRMADEADYYNQVAMRRSHPGEAWHGATRDWELVDVPPGTDRVRMDGAGGGTQEITWQHYNGARKSRFYPDGEDDHYAGYELERAPPPAPIRRGRGDIGGRYGRAKNATDGLWTEITKDLVVKEAIEEMGYEYEETEEFYYVFEFLKYDDMVRLTGLSDDIRKDRRQRLKEIEWENRVAPEPIIEETKKIEAPGPRSSGPFNSENERYIEREIIYRGGRPPPPPGWRR